MSRSDKAGTIESLTGSIHTIHTAAGKMAVRVGLRLLLHDLTEDAR